MELNGGTTGRLSKPNVQVLFLAALKEYAIGAIFHFANLIDFVEVSFIGEFDVGFAVGQEFSQVVLTHISTAAMRQVLLANTYHQVSPTKGNTTRAEHQGVLFVLVALALLEHFSPNQTCFSLFKRS